MAVLDKTRDPIPATAVHTGRPGQWWNLACHARGCERSGPLFGGLLCATHWRRISSSQQAALERTFNSVQFEAGRKPSVRWMTVAQRAIAQLAHREKLIHRNQQALF